VSTPATFVFSLFPPLRIGSCQLRVFGVAGCCQLFNSLFSVATVRLGSRALSSFTVLAVCACFLGLGIRLG